jgi:hypothetical protein
MKANQSPWAEWPFDSFLPRFLGEDLGGDRAGVP